MRRVLALARKELRDIVRERSIVLAFLVQFFVAAFSAFLTVGLVGLYDPESGGPTRRADIAYVGPGGFDLVLGDADNLRIHRLDVDVAHARFQSGELDAIVEESYLEADAARTVTLLVPQGEVSTTLLITQFKSLLRDYERELRLDRESRIEQPVVYVTTDANPNVYYGFAYTVLLPLLVLTPVFLAGATAGDGLSQEIQTRTLGLLRSTPLSTAEFVIGKIIVPVTLAPLQVLAWVLLLDLNGLHVSNVLFLLSFTTSLATLLACASVIIALFVRREGQTQAAYALVVLLFFVLSLLLPQDPMNVIGRLGAGAADTLTFVSVGIYAVWGLLLLAAVFELARRRLAADSP